MLMTSNVSSAMKFKKEGFHIPEKKEPIPEILKMDIINFLRVNPNLSNGEATQAFCSRWGGYRVKYGLKFVEQAIKQVTY